MIMDELDRKKIYICGAGRIGLSVYQRLVEVADCYLIDNTFPQEIEYYNIRKHQKDYFITYDFNTGDAMADMASLFKDADIIINCLPHQLNERMIRTALHMKCDYFDLSEDVESRKLIESQKDYIIENKLTFVPGCGVAPGLISNIAGNLIRKEFGGYDAVEEVGMYVGALPVNPDNQLKYNLTWSPHGLINEYCNPCEGIIDWKLNNHIAPLSLKTSLFLLGTEYEAFTTSGGIGTLHNTLNEKSLQTRKCTYRTIRFPGHLDYIKFLVDDLRLDGDRRFFTELMKRLPETDDDFVILHVAVVGVITETGRRVRRSYTRKIESTPQESAIQLITSHGMAEMVKLFLHSDKTCGIIRNEDVDLLI